jgi:hypothetical protein
MVANVVSQERERERVSMLCLQESKLDVIDDSLICNMLGSDFDYAYLPTDGLWGGGGNSGRLEA